MGGWLRLGVRSERMGLCYWLFCMVMRYGSYDR